jgi:hypothetical protein
VAAALSLIAAVAVLIVTGLTPYALVAVGHEGPGLTVSFYLTLLLVCVLAYRLSAPWAWAFTKRFVAGGERSTLPGPLVAPCLREMDLKCPGCKYNWRGLDVQTCPECNSPVTLYIYTEKPPNARWNGLVFAWLAVTLVASGSTVFSYAGFFIQMARYRGAASVYAGVGTFYWVTAALCAIVAVSTFIACVALLIVAVLPKQPNRRARFARQCVFWLASLNAASGVAVVLQMASTSLMGALW